jgi:hypothetical protein
VDKETRYIRLGFQPEARVYNVTSSICFSEVIVFWSLVAGFPPQRPGFEPGSGHVGFVVNKVALRQDSSEYIDFLFLPFHQVLQTHPHPSSSGDGKIGHSLVPVIVDAVPLHPKKQDKIAF